MALLDIPGLAQAGCLVLSLFLGVGGCSDNSPLAPGGSGGEGGAGGSDCGAEAIGACADLLACCREVLINPVYFESCNGVVRQCDQRRCEEVLAGYSIYPICRPVGAGGAGGDGGAGGVGGAP